VAEHDAWADRFPAEWVDPLSELREAERLWELGECEKARELLDERVRELMRNRRIAGLFAYEWALQASKSHPRQTGQILARLLEQLEAIEADTALWDHPEDDQPVPLDRYYEMVADGYSGPRPTGRQAAAWDLEQLRASLGDEPEGGGL
jgi:hypothetical protein